MKNVTLNIGGQLTAGDVVGVSYNNCVVFGWYVEEGVYGSLKYISLSVPANVKAQYDSFIASTDPQASSQGWLVKKYAKGLLFKHMRKDYIVTWSSTNNRAFKINNPEEFFKDAGETEVNYLAGKQILNDLKFPAK